EGSVRYLPLREAPPELQSTEYSMEALNTLVHNINALNKSAVLTHMIRYGSSEKDFSPSGSTKEVDFATRFLETVRYQAFATLESIEQQAQRRKLDARICKLL